MGTEKRERQKANRALRQQQEQKDASRARFTRVGLLIGLALAAILVLVLVVNLLTGDDDEPTPDTQPAGTEVADTQPADTEPADTEPADSAPADTDDASAAEVPTATDDTDEAVAEGAAGAEVVPEDCPPVEGTAERIQSFESAPPFCLDPEVDYSAVFTTNQGEFTVDLDQDKAPNTVNNFVFLARNRYFDETECHRIIEGFVVQCGDPTATGTGGPGYQFADELPESGEYELGSVAMANSGPDTNGSQFFVITGEDGAALPPDYSLFGSVSSGFDDTVKSMEATGAAGTEPVIIDKVVITTS